MSVSRILPVILIPLLLGQLQGCASFVASQTGKFAGKLSSAIYNNSDVESVGQAIPTFLILVDGMIESSPKNPALLKTGAQLYDAYSGLFVEDVVRKQRLSDRSIAYARASVCSWREVYCGWQDMDFQILESQLQGLTVKDLPYAYTLAVSWLNWIRAHSDDWNALAQVPWPEKVLKRVLELDEAYEDGMAQLYAGALATLLPPALGGKPEQGREHFERAIAISEGRNMMAKVVYAEQYARLMFDQPLHHRLLTEVVQGDPNIHNYVLINTVAQRQAAALLESESDSF